MESSEGRRTYREVLHVARVKFACRKMRRTKIECRCPRFKAINLVSSTPRRVGKQVEHSTQIKGTDITLACKILLHPIAQRLRCLASEKADVALFHWMV